MTGDDVKSRGHEAGKPAAKAVDRPLPPFSSILFGRISDLASSGLTRNDYRVLFALIKSMQYNEPFHYSNAAIAAEADIHASNVSTSIKRLIGHGFLFRVTDRRDLVLLHPQFFWRGNNRRRVEWVVMLRQKWPQFFTETPLVPYLSSMLDSED